ncbi:MAG: hypothetical protein JNN07_09235, partial [Verrucomicrobiales bacterium]|nr:hypothetical protein [Verrucomicrobiales bacterium]
VDWSVEHPNPDEFTLDFAQGNGVMVRVGYVWMTDGTQHTAIWFSRDGSRWTLSDAGRSHVSGVEHVAFGNGRFVVPYEVRTSQGLGGCLVSTDGEHWVQSQPVEPPIERVRLLHFSEGRFTAGFGGKVLHQSEDGLRWRRLSGTALQTTPIGLARSGSIWVAVAPSAAILWSNDDGASWSFATHPEARSLSDVAAAEGVFVAVGEDGKILTSTDGATWTARDSGIVAPLDRVQHERGVWWVFGAKGLVLTSADALTWNILSSPAPSFSSVAGGDKGFVAVGRGVRGYSPDGLTWDFKPATNCSSVAYGNSIFVCGSDRLHVSSNGLDWVDVETGLKFLYGTVLFGQEEFLLVTQRGPFNTAFTSEDGFHWEERYRFETWILNDVIAVGGRYFASDEILQRAGFLDELPWTTAGTPEPSSREAFSAIASAHNKVLFFSEEGCFDYSPILDCRNRGGFLGDPLIQRAMTVGRDIFLIGGGVGYRKAAMLPQLWRLDSDELGFAVDTMPPVTRSIASVASDGRSAVVAVGDGLVMYHRLGDDFLDTPKLHIYSEAGTIRVSFYHSPGFTYTLQYSMNLSNWELEPRSPEGVSFSDLDYVGGMTNWKLPAFQGTKFFRLLVE